MIEDVIDTFRNATPVVNEEFVRKLKLRQVPVTLSDIQKIDMSIMSFQVTPLCCKMFKFAQ